MEFARWPQPGAGRAGWASPIGRLHCRVEIGAGDEIELDPHVGNVMLYP